MQGFGIFTYSNGCQIEGSWDKGKCHGDAIFRYEHGEEHKGRWDKGVHKEWYEKSMPVSLKKYERMKNPILLKQNSVIES